MSKPRFEVGDIVIHDDEGSAAILPGSDNRIFKVTQVLVGRENLIRCIEINQGYEELYFETSYILHPDYAINKIIKEVLDSED